VDGRVGGRVDGRVGGWMGGWVGGWVDGWVNGQVGGWMAVHMDLQNSKLQFLKPWSSRPSSAPVVTSVPSLVSGRRPGGQ
jgi:hypothetical protein